MEYIHGETADRYCDRNQLFFQGRIAEAAPIFERTLAAQRLLYKSNGKVADTLASLAQVRLVQGDAPAAESLVREALAAHQGSGSTAYAKIGYLQTLPGMVLLKQSRFADTEHVLRETLELFAKSLPPDHQYVASAEHYRGEALAGTGKLADAEALFIAATNRWKRTDAPLWRSARSASALGEVLSRQRRTQEAERYLVSSYVTIVTTPGGDSDTREKARERVHRFLSGRQPARQVRSADAQAS